MVAFAIRFAEELARSSAFDGLRVCALAKDELSRSATGHDVAQSSQPTRQGRQPKINDALCGEVSDRSLVSVERPGAQNHAHLGLISAHFNLN